MAEKGEETVAGIARGRRVCGLLFAAAAFSFGAIPMAGWIFDQPQWRSFLVSGSQMKANTALCLILVSVAAGLSAAWPTQKAAQAFVRILAAIAAIFAALTAVEYFVGWNFGIDELLFRDGSVVGTSSPGRMSPPSAVTLLFGAIAVLLLRYDKSPVGMPAQWFALAMAFAPSHILMSYIYGNMNVLAFGSRRSYMAVPTALALLCVALAILAQTADRGVMRTLTSRTAASRVFRYLLLALLLVPPFLGWTVLKLLGGSSAPPEFGVSTTIMLCIVVLAALAWLNAAQLNQAELAMQQAKRSADEANRTKDQFLAMLSHELRTPLTPVLMAASALEKNPDLTANVREQLAMIRRNIELEARLIDDLLDVTRIVHGKLELHEELVDVHALIELALRISAADLLGKKLQVTKYFQATMHRCQADAARLQEVFWNIIRNAVKFTPEHGQIAITTRNDERQQIVIEFTDSGMGIEPELQPRIFDAFAQGEGAMTARMRGLGLGLAISKRIVDLHGGTIQVRSAGRGQGSTFIITLSAVAELSARPAEPSTEISVEPAPALEILIVEDHEDTAHVLCRILETTGYQVVLARTLLEARTLAATRRFQLVISDLGLPDGSGLDLMRELRGQQDIDGIAISGYGTAEDRRASEAAGFSEHLTKPVDVERLQAAIRDSLSRIKTAPVVMPERSAARF